MPIQKFLFVTGGVVSSLGKGLTTASLGLLLERMGYKVALIKMDPYLNVDPGTMNPFQHGEVYVTDDGAETDLDLGHYCRYTDSPLSRVSSMTSGQVYHNVITKERRGEYLGQTVQVIPHITDEIKRRLLACAQQEFPGGGQADIVIAEVGGTVGDIESLPFFEAIRQFHAERRRDCVNLHLTYVPYLKAAGEVKTKPTQHSVSMLQRLGLFPDVIICRSEVPLARDVKDKIALFCNVNRDAVFEATDVKHTIYELPLLLQQQGVAQAICRFADLEERPTDLKDWEALIERRISTTKPVTIGFVGKYLQLQDAYKSVFESLDHAAMAVGRKLIIKRIDAEEAMRGDFLEKELSSCDGCLVPGGFGERGWEGKIAAARYCRENKLPYFGICLGMQVLCTEFARNVAGLEGANTTEIDPAASHPVISLLSEQHGIKDRGGTMRLGAFPCKLEKGSLAAHAYKSLEISERHRHRYEFNNTYKELLESKGLLFSGTEVNRNLCEIAEVKDHPWMVGVQFHPEFKSHPTAPHPLFLAFVQAAAQN